jgi:alpha-ketoglutarate-dependent 2,4-dichlorophenoxyacetate dioxygenase
LAPVGGLKAGDPAQARSTPVSLSIRPIASQAGGPHVLAAEVAGFSIRDPHDDGVTTALEAAMNEHAVLVFPDQPLDGAAQVAFVKRFGPLDAGRTLAVKTKSRLAAEMIDLSNLDENGFVFDRNSRKILSNMGTRLWHTDSSYKRPAAKFSALACYARPSWGGETEFCDLRAAYDSLPEALRREAEGRFAEHWVHHSRSTLGFEPTADEIKAAMDPVTWPLVRTHSGSGRKLVYIGSHARRVVGLSLPEGRILLRDLLEHATQPRFTYKHAWRVGDIVMWDNRAVLHRGCRYDVAEPRDMRRVTCEDMASLNEAQAPQDAASPAA